MPKIDDAARPVCRRTAPLLAVALAAAAALAAATAPAAAQSTAAPAATATTAAATRPASAGGAAAERDVETEFDLDDGLEVRGARWRASAGARLHLDAASFSGGSAPGADDGLLVRRARLGGRAEYGDWTVRADYEFGTVGRGFKNAWLGYTLDRRSSLRLGSQVAPFGLEDTISSDNLPFLERSSAGALGPGLLTGLAYRTRVDRWTFAIGAFGNNLSDDDRRDLDGRSLVARVTHVPYRERGVLVHLGASAEYRDASGDATFRLRPPIGTRVGDLRLLDTTRLVGVQTLTNVGFEAGARLGAFTLQGEYVQSQLARRGFTDPAFSGWYVGGTWAVTGERRRYSRASGAFGAMERPDGPLGAIEIAVRYGTLDLVDAGVDGGTEQSLSLGVNWYVRPKIRAMLSHQRIDAERRGLDLDAPDLTMARVQVAF